MTAATFGFACWSDLAAVMTTAHQHNDLEFNLADADLCYLVGGERIVVGAGRLAAFWGATPHQLIETHPTTVITWLTVPLERALRWRLPTDLTCGLLGGQVLAAPKVWSGSEAPRRLAQWRGDLVATAEPAAAHLADLEAEAFVGRFAAVATSVSPSAGLVGASSRGDGRAPRAAAAMASFIAANFADPLRVADIAAAVHLHPTYATALFSRAFGVPPAAYLLKLRLGEAQRMLLRDDSPIADVAASCGFASQSAFYEAFNVACDVPPGKWRRAHRSAAS